MTPKTTKRKSKRFTLSISPVKSNSRKSVTYGTMTSSSSSSSIHHNDISFQDEDDLGMSVYVDLDAVSLSLDSLNLQKVFQNLIFIFIFIYVSLESQINEFYHNNNNNNIFVVKIPPETFKCNRLAELVLDHNELSEIPSNISQLTSKYVCNYLLCLHLLICH